MESRGRKEGREIQMNHLSLSRKLENLQGKSRKAYGDLRFCREAMGESEPESLVWLGLDLRGWDGMG